MTLAGDASDGDGGVVPGLSLDHQTSGAAYVGWGFC